MDQFIFGGENDLGTVFSKVYNAVGGETAVGDVFSGVYNTVGGKTSVGGVFSDVYKAVGGETAVGDVFSGVYKAVGGETAVGDVFSGVYNTVGGKTSVGGVFSDVYKAVGGETAVGDVFSGVYQVVGGETAVGDVFSGVYNTVGGKTSVGGVFSDVYKAVGGETAVGDVFSDVYKAVGGTTDISALFTSINRSPFFGVEPWMNQKVASDMFYRIAQYRSLSEAGDRMTSDFYIAKYYTNIVASGTLGGAAGVVALPFVTLGYIAYGGVSGAYNSGLPGLAGGAVNGLWKGLTFSIRNAYRERVLLDSTGDPKSIWARLLELIKSDGEQLSNSEFIFWNVADPNIDSAPLDPVGLVTGPIGATGSHAKMAELGGGQPTVGVVVAEGDAPNDPSRGDVHRPMFASQDTKGSSPVSSPKKS